MGSRRLCLGSALLLLLAGCGSSTNKATGTPPDRPLVLTLANWQHGDADVGEWARVVEQRSRGTIRIEIRGDWRSGEIETDRGTLGDVRAGRIDIGHIAARAWDTLGVDSFRALEAPLLVDSLDLEQRVLESDLGPTMLAGIDDAGVVGLALIPGPMMHPVGVSRDLRGPADYRGARFAHRPSGLDAETLAALGAQVVGIPSAGRLDGLDGSVADVGALDLDALGEQSRSMTVDVTLWPRVTTLVINREAWERLTAAQRDVLAGAWPAAMAPALERERTFVRGGTSVACEQRFPLVTAGAAELAALRRTVQPVYRRLERSSDTAAILGRIRALKETVPAPPAPACADDGQAEPGASSGRPLVGVWTVDVSRAEMAAAPRGPGEGVEDNYGAITLDMGADGRFAMRNDRYPGQRVGYGSWSADDETITFTPGGTISMGTGETWEYRWSVFRDTLELRRLTIGPTVLTVAPLRRR